MKTLVVYYSRTGTCKGLAQKIAKEFNSDIEELIDKKNRMGPLGWLGGGKDAAEKKLTQIEPTKYKPELYDLVIIGSPIWAGNMTPAIRTYLTENKNKIKNTAAFCTMGGNNPGQYFSNLASVCDKNACATLAIQQKEANSEKVAQLIKEFKNKI